MFMESKVKEQYSPPRSELLEMTLEGVIAASGGEYHGFGEETPLT